MLEGTVGSCGWKIVDWKSLENKELLDRISIEIVIRQIDTDI